MNRRAFLSNLLAGAVLGLAKSLPMPAAPREKMVSRFVWGDGVVKDWRYRVRTPLPEVTFRPINEMAPSDIVRRMNEAIARIPTNGRATMRVAPWVNELPVNAQSLVLLALAGDDRALLALRGDRT